MKNKKEQTFRQNLEKDPSKRASKAITLIAAAATAAVTFVMNFQHTSENVVSFQSATAETLKQYSPSQIKNLIAGITNRSNEVSGRLHITTVDQNRLPQLESQLLANIQNIDSTRFAPQL